MHCPLDHAPFIPNVVHGLRCLSVLGAIVGSPISAAAQLWTTAEGPRADALTVRVHDERQPSAPRIVVRAARLLPIEITNRTAQQAWMPAMPRLRTAGGAPRHIALPGGGSVYRYARDGDRTWGFLLVTAAGDARVLLELPGAGTAGTGDPFTDRIGVAPDGGHAAIASSRGGLWIARLDGGVFKSTQAPARPVTVSAPVEELTLTAGASVLFYMTGDDKVWRVPLADGGVPVEITPSGPPASRPKDEFAPSGDGRTVAFLYGPKDLERLYLAGETGAARVLPPPAADYEEPGYLPENVGGPRMMLDHDGGRLLFTDGTLRDEIFLLDTTGQTPTVQITGDAHFQPYIGIGVLPTFADRTVVMAIGDPNAFDLYAASTTSQTVVNLTPSPGNDRPPFGRGHHVLHALATNDAGDLLAVDQVGTAPRRLLRIAGGKPAELAADVVGVPELGDAAAGSGLPDLLVQTARGDLLVARAPLTALLQAPAGLQLGPTVRGAVGLRVLPVAVGGTDVVVLLVPGLGAVPLPVDAAWRGLALSEDGYHLAWNAADLVVYRPQGAVKLAGAAAVRLLLSGHRL